MLVDKGFIRKVELKKIFFLDLKKLFIYLVIL